MGMTIEELKFIRIQLTRINHQEDERKEAREIIQREINLKEMDPRLKTDISGHSMNED